MVRTLLIRGMLVGALAGLLGAVFAYVFGEPPVDSAIAYEDQLARAAGEAEAAALVSRDVQRTVGLLTGIVAYGVAFGGIFSLVFATVSGRIGRLGPRATSALLALVVFLVVILVPFLKYPANPPASSIDTTIDDRTSLFWIMVLASVLVAAGAAALCRWLVARFGTWNATQVAVGGYVVVIVAVGFAMPAVSETPADFSAPVLYDFRLASLGIHLVLWTTIGLLFGALTERSLRRQHSPAATASG
ncbi:MAG: CbtA family protein [Actinomycetota bacterium]|nr:CbtA family protein [Actinomycetota bacterium]